MGYTVRNRSSPEYIPAVVAKARLVLRRNELMKEMEEAKRRMYSFMREDHKQQPHGNTFLTDIDDDDDESEIRENQVRNKN